MGTFLISATFATDGERHDRHYELKRRNGPRTGAVLSLQSLYREGKMLYTIAVLLLIAWLLGMVGTYTVGSFIHVLLVVAVVLFLVGLIGGRRTIP